MSMLSKNHFLSMIVAPGTAFLKRNISPPKRLAVAIKQDKSPNLRPEIGHRSPVESGGLGKLKEPGIWRARRHLTCYRTRREPVRTGFVLVGPKPQNEPQSI